MIKFAEPGAALCVITPSGLTMKIDGLDESYVVPGAVATLKFCTPLRKFTSGLTEVVTGLPGNRFGTAAERKMFVACTLFRSVLTIWKPTRRRRVTVLASSTVSVESDPV